jgi:hypothetical protein
MKRRIKIKIQMKVKIRRITRMGNRDQVSKSEEAMPSERTGRRITRVAFGPFQSDG